MGATVEIRIDWDGIVITVGTEDGRDADVVGMDGARTGAGAVKVHDVVEMLTDCHKRAEAALMQPYTNA